MFDIKENLKKLPDCPGVYMHKDRLGNVIYVGKAVNLRNRVRQYFQTQKNMAPKVRSMVSQIEEFEYITVDSEMEALILECNLIKKYRPKYNILLRDDKTYPYIKVTNEEWPRIVKTRIVKKDGGTYFGPYSDAGAVNTIVDLLNSTFALKRCSATAFAEDFRPCLNYHINQCRGVCGGAASKAEYDEAVRGATDFLKGQSRALTDTLKAKMMAASEAMEYEEAAGYRDYLEAAKSLSETQRVVLHHSNEADIVVKIMEAVGTGGDGAKDALCSSCAAEENGCAADENCANFVAVFSVRDGKLVGRESFSMEEGITLEGDNDDMIGHFIRQHYGSIPNVPREIIVAEMPEDAELLEEYISTEAGHNVKITKPERGEKRALLKLAEKDALEMARSIDERAKAAKGRRTSLGNEIWNVLVEMGMEEGKYDGREFRAESYDISNTNGVDTVGAMIVYKGLVPDRQSYRKFRVRSVAGQDDYASMREVLSRRFMRVFKGDEKFAVLPDIIFMDGGKGHVSTALEVIDATGFDIPVAGMVKDDRHRTRALVYRDRLGTWKEIDLTGRPMLYKYLGSMQEEVHRFAIEYHRKVRSRSLERSVLDEIEGIGPKRRKALLTAFGSVEEIRRIARNDAGVSDAGMSGAGVSDAGDSDAGASGTGESALKRFASVEGMNTAAAEKIIEFFRT